MFHATEVSMAKATESRYELTYSSLKLVLSLKLLSSKKGFSYRKSFSFEKAKFEAMEPSVFNTERPGERCLPD